MFIKLSVVLFLLEVSQGQSVNQAWDLAIAVNSQIKLLNFNGTVIEAAAPEFQKLKAITYDHKRKQFIASENNRNDTIYSLQLSKETDVTPLIEDLPDDIQGIAVDPVDDVFYWTDSITKTIKYKSLKANSTDPSILFKFDNEKPQDIVIDSCKRKLYWTNSEMNKATIDSATLDGQNHTILVKKGLFMPMGIALDQARQKLYWAEVKSGIYFSIGSINLDGTGRNTVLSGTHQKPFGLAVDGDYLYWTDIPSQALWRKNLEDPSDPEMIVSFDEHPYGLVARNMGFSREPDCNNLTRTVAKSNDVAYKDRTCNSCLNNGNMTKDCNCVCPLGFIGDRCETNVCPSDYCVHGYCKPSPSGSPRCYCSSGFIGKRCEKNLCDSYCLNGGLCTYQDDEALCTCPDGYIGSRCDVLNLTETAKEIGCIGSANCLPANMNTTSSNKLFGLTWAEFLSQDGITRFQDPLFSSLLGAIVILVCIIIILISITYHKDTKRTRVKKRIIVNKNITPLSFEPQPITQCEITIENCCNMNLCETPCFEPPNVRNFSGSEKDEKKTLLLNMEHNNGDDLY